MLYPLLQTLILLHIIDCYEWRVLFFSAFIDMLKEGKATLSIQTEYDYEGKVYT
ncbi:hypothetical protein HX037_10145 [Ignatzschineria indica]|uniref:hypothetical protein n=1 Tax=Ignatzschineria indica TaxID=472583 RepID=UPI002578D045|nr:hypothetical protein [Ignatzschineria indica]MDM1546226.1 hypothetical protein [Ignatzschineria indica]